MDGQSSMVWVVLKVVEWVLYLRGGLYEVSVGK